MRFQALVTVLLAVTSNVSAGLVRYHDRPVRQVSRAILVDDRPLTHFRHGHYVRSFNQSTIVPDASQHAESTPITSYLSSSSPPTQSPSSTQKPGTTLSKQIGSVPAEGSGPGAAKIDPASLNRPSTAQPVLSSSDSAAASSQAQGTGTGSGLVPVQSGGLGRATFNSEDLTQTPPLAKSTAQPPATSPVLPSAQQAQSASGSSSQSAAASTSSTTSATRLASTFTTRLSLGTGVATPASLPSNAQPQPVTSASSLTLQSASSTAQVQSTPSSAASGLVPPTSSGSTTSSGSSTSSSPQVGGPSLSDTPITKGGNVAIANAYNQQFKTLTPDSECSSKDRTQAHACINGLFAECNNAGRYTMTACSEGQQCFALPMPAGSTGIFVQCDKPSDANQKLQSSNPSKSSSAAPSSTASSSMAIAATSTATSTPVTVSVATPVSPTAKQTPVQGTTTQDTEPSTTQTTFETATASSITQPAPFLSQQSSAMATASSTDVPLIISFPSSSSTVPKPSLQPSKPTKLQNPAPAPASPSGATSQESLTQPSPAQQPPTSSPTTAATTASAASPGITIVPLGSDDSNSKQKTVTVTVTERL